MVSNKAQFCSIVKTGLGDARLILGGEVDAGLTLPPLRKRRRGRKGVKGSHKLKRGLYVCTVWDQKTPSDLEPSPAAAPPPNDPTNYIELKTSKEVTSRRDEVAFERKLQKFWSQSFLLGVGKIIVGFRDDGGVLKSVTELDTQAIPTIAKRSGRNLWDGKLTIDFTASVLKWLLETIVEDDDNRGDGNVWLISHAENSPIIEVSKTDSPSFLTPSFVKWRSENSLS